jgi:hypothetical protein
VSRTDLLLVPAYAISPFEREAMRARLWCGAPTGPVRSFPRRELIGVSAGVDLLICRSRHAGMAWRTNRLSLRTIGPWSNRLLLVGIAVEVAMIALLAYTPGLDDIFHTSALGPWHWLFLLAWPPVVLGAEEARKAMIRRADRRSA